MEIEALNAGTLTFTIALMHSVNGESHPDFTSDPITVNVAGE